MFRKHDIVEKILISKIKVKSNMMETIAVKETNLNIKLPIYQNDT